MQRSRNRQRISVFFDEPCLDQRQIRHVALVGDNFELFSVIRSGVEGIKDRNTRWLKIRHITGHNGEDVFKYRCRNHKISAVIAKSSAQLPPTSGYLQIEGQNPFTVENQYAVEPSCKRRGKIRISCALPRNTTFDFTNSNDADEKFGRSLPFDP